MQLRSVWQCTPMHWFTLVRCVYTGSPWWGVCVCVHWCHSQPCWLTIGGTNMTNGSPRWLMKTLCVCLCISQVIISCTSWTGHGKLLQYANEDLVRWLWWGPLMTLCVFDEDPARCLHQPCPLIVPRCSPQVFVLHVYVTEGERQHQADVFVNLVDSLPSCFEGCCTFVN